MLKKRINKLLFMIIFICFIFIYFLGYNIWKYSYKDELVKTDAAIVLGAAVWGDEPSPVFKERINHSIWLYKHGYVDKIIFTGGKDETDQYAESEVAREYAIDKNINKKDILIEMKSKITEENLEYAYDIAKMNNLNTFTLVSDPLHMKRASLIAKQHGLRVYSSPTKSSAYKTVKSKVSFFLRELFFYIVYMMRISLRQ